MSLCITRRQLLDSHLVKDINAYFSWWRVSSCWLTSGIHELVLPARMECESFLSWEQSDFFLCWSASRLFSLSLSFSFQHRNGMTKVKLQTSLSSDDTCDGIVWSFPQTPFPIIPHVVPSSCKNTQSGLQVSFCLCYPLPVSGWIQTCAIFNVSFMNPHKPVLFLDIRGRSLSDRSTAYSCNETCTNNLLWQINSGTQCWTDDLYNWSSRFSAHFQSRWVRLCRCENPESPILLMMDSTPLCFQQKAKFRVSDPEPSL